MRDFTPEEIKTLNYIVHQVIFAHQYDNSYRITAEAELEESERFRNAITLLKKLSPESFIKELL